MLDGIKVLCHSSIKIVKNKIIYIDPYKIKEEKHDADIIFITHDHYDHYSKQDIDKIIKNDTKIIMPMNKNDYNNIIVVEPNKNYEIDNIKVKTINSYNINKPFHPKSNNWVGYILTIDGINYYIAGDTDITDENKLVKCDVAFLPIGGTFTMDYKEAATLANIIKPQIAIPIHYGLIVGSNEDAEKFSKLLNENIQYINLMDTNN